MRASILGTLKIGQGNGKFPVCEMFLKLLLIAFSRFSWANGMFGQMILHLESHKPYLLAESYQ